MYFLLPFPGSIRVPRATCPALAGLAAIGLNRYTCYDLIRPDVALELAWKHGYMDMAMPFLIQFVRHSTDKIKQLEERTAPQEDPNSMANEAMKQAAESAALGYTNPVGGGMMLTDTAYNPAMAGVGGYGAPMGQMGGQMGQMGGQMGQMGQMAPPMPNMMGGPQMGQMHPGQMQPGQMPYGAGGGFVG